MCIRDGKDKLMKNKKIENKLHGHSTVEKIERMYMNIFEAR